MPCTWHLLWMHIFAQDGCHSDIVHFYIRPVQDRNAMQIKLLQCATRLPSQITKTCLERRFVGNKMNINYICITSFLYYFSYTNQQSHQTHLNK